MKITLVGVIILRELELSQGVFTRAEKVGERRADRSIHLKGGRTPLNTKMLSLSTCTCSLVSIKVDVNNIKLKKERTSTNSEAEVKIEILAMSFLSGYRSGVVKFSLLGFSMWEWLREQLTIGVLYLHNVTRTHNKCRALPKVNVQPYLLGNKHSHLANSLL